MAWLKNYVIRRSNSPIFFQISVGANNCLHRSSAKPATFLQYLEGKKITKGRRPQKMKVSNYLEFKFLSSYSNVRWIRK